MNNIISFQGRTPDIHRSAYIDSSSRIIGDVRIGKDASIWTGAVARADENQIKIEDNVAILENAFLEAPREFKLTVEADCLVAHGAILHGCTILKESMIGIAAIVLDGAVVREGSIIGAGALVPEGKVIAPRSLFAGSPGKVLKEVTKDHFDKIRGYHRRVWEKAKEYKRMQV